MGSSSSPTRDTGLPLDVAVREARRAARDRDLPEPHTLFLLGTGFGLLPERLERATDLRLGELAGVPARWRDARLFAGHLDGHPVWMLEDGTTDPLAGSASTAGAGPERAAAWEAAFPVWLAAATGARLLLHTSAGSGLHGDGPHRVGTFALASDHLNLSGGTPLLGLGESSLGPLFPDLSLLHEPELRAAARRRGEALGLELADGVVACTLGPAIETPAERRFLAAAGADVAVQGLATPLLAAAHAGMRALAVVAIADQAPGPTRLREVVEAAGALEAALEDLLIALAPDLDEAARRAADEL
ncbi:MAG: hypothetical protein AAF682_15825 [Planctomycetota bacterium]